MCQHVRIEVMKYYIGVLLYFSIAMRALNFISKNIFVVDDLGLIHYLGLMILPTFQEVLDFIVF